MDKKTIYNELMENYYNYYYDVYYTFVYEAIENTLRDLKNKNNITIEQIHKHITENYI